MDDYSHELHRSTLLEFCRILDLNDVTLVVQDWGGLTGLSAVRDMPDRIDQVRRGECMLAAFVPNAAPLTRYPLVHTDLYCHRCV